MTFHRAPPDVNGFGGDDLDAGLGEVGPAGDVLRVALAHDEHDDRVGDVAAVLILVPIGGDEAFLDEPGHVGLQRERDVVGAQPGNDCPALVA